jgi:hypothetical protein
LIRREQAERNPKYCISKVVTTDGEIIEFKTFEGKGGIITDDRIEGFLKDNTLKSIPLSKVEKIYVRKLNVGKTILVSVGGTTVFLLAGALAMWLALRNGPLGEGPM